MLEQCQARRDALLGLLRFDLGSPDVSQSARIWGDPG